MAPSISKVIQQALLAAAAPMIVSCGAKGNPTGRIVVTAPVWADGGVLGAVPTSEQCSDACNPLGPFGCTNPGYQGCVNLGLSADGGIAIDCLGESPLGSNLCGFGRRTQGYADCTAAGPAVGRYFAEGAYLEAVSVFAFRRLARELVAHRAPPPLVRAARRAEADEVRHLAAMSRLARGREMI